jgi:hypothetical protein
MAVRWFLRNPEIRDPRGISTTRKNQRRPSQCNSLPVRRECSDQEHLLLPRRLSTRSLRRSRPRCLSACRRSTRSSLPASMGLGLPYLCGVAPVGDQPGANQRKSLRASKGPVPSTFSAIAFGEGTLCFLLWEFFNLEYRTNH